MSSNNLDKRVHILVVDDEEMFRDFVAMLLMAYGYEVTCASDAMSALEACQSAHDNFDLVLTDQYMPGLPGDKFAEKVKEVDPSQHVVLMTGGNYELDDASAISAMLKKPFTNVAVMDVVERYTTLH